MAGVPGAENGSGRRHGGSESTDVGWDVKDSRAAGDGSGCGDEGRRNGEMVLASRGGSGIVVAEIKLQCRLAWPIILANLLSYSFVLVSVMFVGHLGELELSSVSIANSFAVVSGFSVIVGLATAMETLCGQAYGAQRYHLLGVYLQSSVMVTCTFVIPIFILWLNMEKFLLAVGQDPEISHLAASYVRYMSPGLFSAALTQPLIKYLQSQSLVVPIMINSLIAAILHPFICYALIYVLGFGYIGGAIATTASYYLLGILNVAYVLCSGKCRKCWGGFALREALACVGTYVSLALPSMIMICLEFWSFELLVLSSGLLPSPSLELSLLTISLNTVNLSDMVPLGLCVASSVRVSNELGANRPDAAKLAVKVVLGLALLDGCVVSSALLLFRRVWGYAFTDIPEVLDYVDDVIPFLALLIIMDAVQAVFSGVLRGSGRQALGASINLAAYYVVGIPTCLFLGFKLHLNGKGLLMGLMGAIFIQAALLLILVSCSNWKNLAKQAQDRLLQAPSEHEPLLPSTSENLQGSP